MSEFSDYMENAIINQMRNVAGVQVAVYVALFTASTGLEADSGWSGTEVSTSGTAYARKLAGLSAASGGTSSNAADITWTQATASWGTVSHVALMDAVSTGHVLMWSALDASKAIDTGDTFKINAGDLDITVD
jgi:hypothetical protein